MHRIVVFDPTGKFPEGEILEGEKSLTLLHGKGGVTLPVEPNLLGRNAVSGFFMRKWGKGSPFTALVGTRACPMILFAVPEFNTIHWAARIEPIVDAPEVRGTFRLAMHSGQTGTITGGLAADGKTIEIAELPRDKFGGWTLVGASKLNCTMEGYLGLSLYGTAIGARVMWTAVSQAR